MLILHKLPLIFLNAFIVQAVVVKGGLSNSSRVALASIYSIPSTFLSAWDSCLFCINYHWFSHCLHCSMCWPKKRLSTLWTSDLSLSNDMWGTIGCDLQNLLPGKLCKISYPQVTLGMCFDPPRLFKSARMTSTSLIGCCNFFWYRLYAPNMN